MQHFEQIRLHLDRLQHQIESLPPELPQREQLHHSLTTLETAIQSLQIHLTEQSNSQQNQQKQQNEPHTSLSESDLKPILDNAIAAITRFQVFENHDFEYDYYSGGCQAIFGFTAAELVTEKSLWMSQVHPEDRDKVILPVFADIFAQRTVTVEYRYFHKSGDLRWITTTYASQRDDQQQCWIVTAVSTDITQRKLAEEALRQNEERFRVGLQNSPITVFSQDQELRYTWIYNPTEPFQTSEVIGHRDWDLLLATDASRLTQIKQQVLVSGVGTRQEVVLTHGSKLHYYNLIVEPLKDESGRVTSIICAATDITPFKQMEAEIRCLNADLEQRVFERTAELSRVNQELQVARQLAETEQRRYHELYNFYREVVEDQTELICRYRPDGTLTFINEAVCRYANVQVQDIIGQQLMEFVVPEDREPLAQHLASLNHEHPVGELERRSILPNGEIRWQQWCDRALFNTSGEIVEIQSVGRDITERKQSELALQESEERFRQLAENIREVFWMTDALKHKCIYVSSAWEEVWGYSCESLYEDIAVWRKSILPEDRQQVNQSVEQLKQGEGFDIEYRIMRADGAIRWIRDRAFPLRNTAGVLYRWVGIAEDISDRKAVEAQLWRSLFEKEVLLREIHHRVKNNLQIISSLLKIQARRVHDPSVQEILMDSQNRVFAMALVHEHLYNSPDFVQVCMSDYIRTLASSLFQSYQIHPDLIQLRVEINVDTPLCLEKAIPCGLILNELLTNALKHGFSNGRQGEIFVSLTALPLVR